MSTKHDLDTLDRATLVAWRATNVLKWSIAALALAFAAATVFYLALSALPRFAINGSTRGGAGLIALLTAVPTALSAIAIGVVVGRHVTSRPFFIAAMVAVAHIALSWVLVTNNVQVSAPLADYAFFTPANGGAGATPMLLLVILEVYASGSLARRAWAKRPRALRAA